MIKMTLDEVMNLYFEGYAVYTIDEDGDSWMLEDELEIADAMYEMTNPMVTVRKAIYITEG